MDPSMIHCAKCGAELIGSRKFCTACGAPAVDLRSTGSSLAAVPPALASVPAAGGSAPSIAYGAAPPVPSQVNPFAQTAIPKDRVSEYGPPPAALPIIQPPPASSPSPAVGAPLPAAGTPAAPIIEAAPVPSPVSPLAVSNVVSGRNALDEIAASRSTGAPAPTQGQTARTSKPPPLPPRPSKPPIEGSTKTPIAGTMLMPSTGFVLPGEAPRSTVEPDAHQGGTKVMAAFPQVMPKPPEPSPAPAIVQPMSVPAPAPLPPQAPVVAQPMPAPMPHVPMPAPAPVHAHAHAPYPQQAYPQQPYPQPHYPQAAAPAPYPYGYGAQPMPPPNYGYGYAPGSRVQVTWSDGRRYPGTVQQANGSMHLVVFPDGQQHWVDMPYLAPG